MAKRLRDEVVVGNRIMNEAMVKNRVKRLGSGGK